MKQIQYENNTPIYLQIMQNIKQNIISGKWEPGSRISSVRDLSIVFGVNPNTMQRALTALEQEKLLYSERTSGRYITGDEQIIKELRDNYAQSITQQFMAQMQAIGYNKRQMIQLLEEELP